MSPMQIRQFLTENLLAIGASIVIFLAIVLQGTVFYHRSTDVMQQQLHLRLQTAAALGAQQFSGEELDRIGGMESFETAAYENIVLRLEQIRTVTPNIEYAYIMRRTKDPLALEFVADADSLDNFEETDSDGNGVIEPDEENSYPGDLYDISDIPAMQGPAFEKATVDREITSDQWGDLISGYAPIRRADGTVAGIIGIDMNASDFMTLSREAFSNLAFISMLIIGFVIMLTMVYLLWARRIKTMKVIQDERSAMLALATHQLGGPISSIRWWLEMMYEEGICTKENACGQISRSVQKLNAIIQELIEVERQEHNKVKYKREPTNVAGLLQTSSEHIPRYRREEHTLDISVDASLEASLDRKLIASAVAELMENAMTYSPEGSAVHVEAQKNGRWLHISVADEGDGIAGGEQERILQKMTRGSNAVQRNPNGNGLGLYVVNLIMRHAGGSLKLVSKEGEGSTFTLRIPAF